MPETAARSSHAQPENGPPEREAADLGLLIFASLEHICEQVRLERQKRGLTSAEPPRS